MKILNVCVGLDMRQSGGYAERTFQMSKCLATSEVGCDVLTMDIDLTVDRVAELKPARVHVIPTFHKRFNFPLGGLLTTFKAVKNSDIVHLMGHWYFLNVMAYWATRYYKKPYVVCPAGALSLFGRSKGKKIFFNWLIGKKIVRNASAGIAVIEAEVELFKLYGNLNVHIIPNAINELEYIKRADSSFRRNYNLNNGPILLFMGRLNPIKGPDLILNAYISCLNFIGDYQLVFAGNDEGMQASLEVMCRTHGLCDRVKFIGHIKGKDKVDAYHEAALLVVPSRLEAMSIVAIEAGVCKTPVLITDQCGLNEVNEISTFMEAAPNSIALAESLKHLLGGEIDLERMGMDWYDHVIRKYSWNKVVLQYISLYESILKDTAR